MGAEEAGKKRKGSQDRLQFQAQPSLSLILRQHSNVLHAMCVCPKTRESGSMTADLKLSTWDDTLRCCPCLGYFAGTILLPGAGGRWFSMSPSSRKSE